MDLEIRKGTVEDTEKLICLLREVRENMDHPEWFYLDPAEDVRRMMSDGTMQLWVAMDGERMAAVVDFLIPGMQEFNYGYDLGFSEDLLLRVINMDNAAVRPEYRGLGLQRKLMQEAERSLYGTGEKVLLCTIHPENRFSLQNALKEGYEIQKRLPKYGTVRYILRKNIS